MGELKGGLKAWMEKRRAAGGGAKEKSEPKKMEMKEMMPKGKMPMKAEMMETAKRKAKRTK